MHSLLFFAQEIIIHERLVDKQNAGGPLNKTRKKSDEASDYRGSTNALIALSIREIVSGASDALANRVSSLRGDWNRRVGKPAVSELMGRLARLLDWKSQLDHEGLFYVVASCR